MLSNLRARQILYWERKLVATLNQDVSLQQTQNICITFVQCWTKVEDVGPMYTD